MYDNTAMLISIIGMQLMFLHVQAIAFNIPKPDLKNGIPTRDELHESP
jgi:hypothetical protein